MKEIFNGLGFVFGLTIFTICAAAILMCAGVGIFYFIGLLWGTSKALAIYAGIGLLAIAMFGSFSLAMKCLNSQD